MSTHRLAFPLPPPTAPLFSNSPRKASTSALSSPAPSSNNAFASRQRVDSTESTMSGHVTGGEQWADALSAVETGPLSSRDRSGSFSSFASSSSSSSAFSTDPSTAATSRSGSGAEDLLQCLGRGAVDLLERLESEREQGSPPRVRRRDMGVVEDLVASNDLLRSPLAGSPIAGPSTYQATRRRQHDFPKKLAPSSSISTLRSTSTISPVDHARSASFTSTDISELDIESILDAYGDWGEEEVQVTAPPALERTPRPRLNSSKSNIFPSRTKSISSVSSSSRSVRRELIFPSPALPSVEMDRSVPELPPHPSELPLPTAGPYKELFPRHRVSPFPTKKKSSGSLRSQAFSSANPPPVPTVSLPLPMAPRHLAAPPSPLSSPERPSPARRQSSLYSADSHSSPRSSVRCSYQSSAASSATGSFRWSTASGSTAPTIAEESDWESDRRGSVAASSCRSFGSSQPSRRPSVAGSLRSTKSAKALRPLSEMMDWTTFAEELEEGSNEDGDDEEGSSGDDRRRRTSSIKSSKSCPPAPSAKSLRRAQSSKGLYSSNYSSSVDLDIPAVPALPKKVSTFSLRHLRSSASLAAPTIPSRAGSLHKKAISHGRDE